MEKQLKENSVSFTGHRPSSMPWGYNENDRRCIELKTELRQTILKLISQGKNTFYNGLAEGFDMYACEILVELKKQGYPVYIIGCIPCANQEKYFKDENKKLYKYLTKNCDELYFATTGSYFRGCTHIRNEYMINNSSTLIAYVHSDQGGSFSTRKKAQILGLNIINL